MRIAFLGYGTIARLVHTEIKRRRIPAIEAVAYLDPGLGDDDAEDARASGLQRAENLEELIDIRPDLVLEAASQGAAKVTVPQLLSAGINVVSMSVGAYLDDNVMRLIDRTGRGRLLLPSGALPGVDVVKAAVARGVSTVALVTRKHPRSLAGAPGAAGRELAPDGKPEVVFNGNAAEAVRLFPDNANIAATLSLAGIGAERTRVTIIADPDVQRNTHTVQVLGEFGSYTATVECEVSPNPKTSLLAPLSAVALLDTEASRIRVGT